MSLLKFLIPKRYLKRKILDIKDEIERLVAPCCSERFWVTWYGAVEIAPRYLVIWVCVESDEMKLRLAADKALMGSLRNTLEANGYPAGSRDYVSIGFESQETVDRESCGNWFFHFK